MSLLRIAHCLLLVAAGGFVAQPVSANQSLHPLTRLERACPQSIRDCTADRLAELKAAGDGLDEWAAKWTWRHRPESVEKALNTIRSLVEASQRVDQRLERAISLRQELRALSPGPDRRQKARLYLATTAQLIDLAGRLRYTLRDAIDLASYHLSRAGKLTELLDVLIEKRVSIGAGVLAFVLFDPPSGSELRPFPDSLRAKTLELMSFGGLHAIHDLARFVRQKSSSPALVVQAAALIRRLGLPQTHHPLQSKTSPKPPISAKELHTILSKLKTAELPASSRVLHRELISWLDERATRGVLGETFRVGGIEVRSGDWMLMRNPSPYNAFTDLSPGLFTHVGVAAAATGEDGIRRFVIVDVPERGDRVPAETVDAYLQDTLHWVFLRHPDAVVARKMGQAAASVIGNETKFDLLFETDRVTALAGKPLKGERIHTYCAGFLLLCALQTSRPREEFFPIPEYPAKGHLPRNLKSLGLAMGDNFVSPTGALFSSKLQIVGRRQPLYDPGREVREAVYDHFGWCMEHRRLTPSPDLQQTLRQSLASASKHIPWLAQTLAKANNVSPYMDLEAAAKAAAVVETLDQMARANMEEYFAAHTAVTAPSISELRRGKNPQEMKKLLRYRLRHAELIARIRERRLTPRQLRIEMVNYYKQLGRQRLEERFFPQ